MPYKVKLLNNIAKAATDLLPKELYEVGEQVQSPDAIIVRSADMHAYERNPELVAIARAGAGVNNIPLEECAKDGVVVFNTPGANANAVKELVICALLLCGRDVLGGITWADTSVETGYGKARIRWRLEGETLVSDVTVPVGATARFALHGRKAAVDGHEVCGEDAMLCSGEHTVRLL